MPIKVIFLGRLEDLAGEPERDVAVVTSVEAVIASFEPHLAAALRAEKVKYAVNGLLYHDRAEAKLKDGDEVAFLPPVSGG